MKKQETYPPVIHNEDFFLARSSELSSPGRNGSITDVLLAEIAALDEEKPYAELLKCFGDDQSKSYYVMFRRVHVVDPCVLDLCVFNNDSAATMNMAAACPSRLARLLIGLLAQGLVTVLEFNSRYSPHHLHCSRKSSRWAGPACLQTNGSPIPG